MNDELTKIEKPEPSIIRFRHYHWRSFVSYGTNCAQQETVVDRIEGTVLIICFEDRNELYRVVISADQEWLDEFFHIAEQDQWERLEYQLIVDGESWDTTITFSDGREVEQQGRLNKPEVYQKLEESLRKLLRNKHFPNRYFSL